MSQEGSTSDLRILIEAKSGTTAVKRRQAARQALARQSATPDALALALCYPRHLGDASLSARETVRALKDSTLLFAAVRRFARTPTWGEGSIDNLAETLRNTDLARQRISDSIERAVREVADRLLRDGCALDIASALVLPRTKKNRHAATLVGSLILSNATLLHHRLRSAPDLIGVAPLEDILGSPETAPGIIRGD